MIAVFQEIGWKLPNSNLHSVQATVDASVLAGSVGEVELANPNLIDPVDRLEQKISLEVGCYRCLIPAQVNSQPSQVPDAA